MAGKYGKSVNIASKFFKHTSDATVILGQAIEMRLSTQRGTLWTDPEYGLPLSDYVNEDLTQQKLIRIQSEVRSEIEKDERVNSATVKATAVSGAKGLSLRLEMQISPSNAPSFPLTLDITDLTVSKFAQGA